MENDYEQLRNERLIHAKQENESLAGASVYRSSECIRLRPKKRSLLDAGANVSVRGTGLARVERSDSVTRGGSPSGAATSKTAGTIRAGPS